MTHAAKMCAFLDLLQRRLQDGMDRVRPLDRKDLVNHLLQVSRAIDHAVASKQRPTSLQKVLDVFKIITKLKDEDSVKPAIMVFLLAVKGACGAGWFKPSEADEILSLYDQLLIYFQLNGDCSRQLTAMGSTQEENCTAVALITITCQRYCPRIKLVSVVLSFMTKKDYETRGCDFDVTNLPPKTKLSLFVVQTESMETSACLVTPLSLSFLLNGRGVEKRSLLQSSTETGLQMPSDVTHLLRLGNNFIQVVGESPGNYLVAIAMTTIVPYTSASVELAEYMAPSAEGDGVDDEVVEAGSRVSLRCPISHKRIVTPVKGLVCRHHQCFDFDSFIDMNDIRPVWRCPCCNSNVSCLQLRLDKKMKQILKDVDEKYFEAIINQDGSWGPGQSSDEQKDYTARCFASAGGAESNQLAGSDVVAPESGIIELSDDDEINEVVVSVEKVVSPRWEPRTVTTPSSSEGPEDRKPDTRATCGSNISNSSVLLGTSTTERRNPSAGYAPINVSNQTGVPINHPRCLPESNAGVQHMQNPAPTTHRWSGGIVPMYASALASGQQPGGRVFSMDRHAGPPASGVQSMPGANQALTQRARVGNLPHNVSTGAPLPHSVVSGAAASGGFITTTSQLQSGLLPQVQLASEQFFQHDIHHQQQSQDRLRQMQPNSNSFRAPVELDTFLRSHRRSVRSSCGPQQGTVINDQGTAREVHVQPFGTANPTFPEHLQHSQGYSHLGHNLGVSQQDYWQRVARQQQAVMSSINSRVAGGRSPPVSELPFFSTIGCTRRNQTMGATVDAQQVATTRINSRVVNTGDGNISTTSVVTPGNATGVATPQVINWRPTGRMRGSVSGTFLPGNRVGVNSVASQPGPVNRSRVSPIPNTTSLPQSNSINLVPTTITNSLPTTLLVPNIPSTEGVRARSYSPSRLPTNELSVADGFWSTGETLQDMVWLPTLGLDQVDNSGTQDMDRWLDETLATDISPHGV